MPTAEGKGDKKLVPKFVTHRGLRTANLPQTSDNLDYQSEGLISI